jgi:Tol biopolymer transport system component
MKALTYAVLIVAMCAFGFGVYHAAGALKTQNGRTVRPNAISASALPFTIYVAQQGALYRFKGGTFTQIDGDSGWTQPSASPDGHELVAVMRTGNSSDVYLLTADGKVERQLTHHQSPQVEYNHWAFYPRFSADGTRVFYSYDDKDPGGTYRVDLSIWAAPAHQPGSATDWTQPNVYTGGDTHPVPLRDGTLVYTKYSIDDKSQVHSQIWIAGRPGVAGVALTQPEENCGQPAVSPDEKTVAMICRHDQLQATQLVVASLDAAAAKLGSESVLVQAQLSASPAFSPDGQTIAFLAPVQQGGAFQLWTVPAMPTAPASAARPITSNVGLDSSAAPVWIH